MGPLNLFEGLIEPKVNAILLGFLSNKNELFHLKKLSRLSKVPMSSTFRIVRKLVSLNIVRVVKVHKFKLYQVEANEKTKALEGLLVKNEGK
ncbi:hypothetical protein CMO89_04525 [Candidatus Woesearchaeota archaeon]|nr:hypothetical protein [Candidatus Woesearchaeota archaeon]|tara:strand:+ start:4245 stop:4520 length:276 start_codon:yes stop_codon:yes gene_type:complete